MDHLSKKKLAEFKRDLLCKASGSAAPKVATSAAKATGGAAKATGGAAKVTGGAAKTAAKATAGAAKAVASNKAAGSAENGSATQGIVCPICDQTLSTRKGKQDINRYRYVLDITIFGLI